MMKSRDETSAGGVVFRRTGERIEVLIGKDAGYHKWVLPKGLVNKNEDLQQAALREVTEEVGVVARIVAQIGEPEKYVYTARGTRVFKKVYYYLMEYVSGSEADHDREMEAVRWTEIDEAISTVYYKGARQVLERAKALLTDPAEA